VIIDSEEEMKEVQGWSEFTVTITVVNDYERMSREEFVELVKTQMEGDLNDNPYPLTVTNVY
jgi:hypothetical protein